MNTVAYIACSMDGYIAKSDGDIDWLTSIPNPQNSDYGFDGFMSTVDAVLMGRNTFQTIDRMNYWAYSKQVYVWSSTIKTLDEKYNNKAELITGDIKEIVQELTRKGIKRLYVDGGKTIQSFLREDLLDEIILTTASIVLGSGISLFGELERQLEFDLYKTEKIDSYLVKNYYKRRNRTTCST
jgi:dihydrofolate reductase